MTIKVWIRKEDIVNFTTIYNAFNTHAKIESKVPDIIIFKSECNPNFNYLECNIPYDSYIELINLEKVKEQVENTDTVAELESIKNALNGAAQYKLQSEIIWSAMKSLKNDSNLTIEEVINHGFNEWVK
jgi:hypothetical protein